jgi:predicted HNH restriction endonuclease
MGVIYIIKHKESDNCYIGSTKDFEKRRKLHKYACDNEKDDSYNLKKYQFMRENGGFENFDMVEICKCDNDKLLKTEQYYIDCIKPSLNSGNAYFAYKEEIELSSKKYEEEIKKRGVKCEVCDDTYLKEDKAIHLKSKFHLHRVKIKKRGIKCEVCGHTYLKEYQEYHLKSTFHLYGIV